MREHSIYFHVGLPGTTPPDECGENALAAFEFAEHRVGESAFVTQSDKRKLDEALGVRDREIAEEQSVDEGEDGNIRADAEGQGKNCDGGEAGILAQAAEGITEILPKPMHGG